MDVRNAVVGQDPPTLVSQVPPVHDIAGVIADPVVAVVAADDGGLQVGKPGWQGITVVALAGPVVEEDRSRFAVGLGRGERPKRQHQRLITVWNELQAVAAGVCEPLRGPNQCGLAVGIGPTSAAGVELTRGDTANNECHDLFLPTFCLQGRPEGFDPGLVRRTGRCRTCNSPKYWDAHQPVR